MIAKRATAEAQQIESHLVIKHGCYGYYAIDNRYIQQAGTSVRATASAVLADLRAGKRPRDLRSAQEATNV